MYVKAVIDLYKRQVALGTNRVPHPSGQSERNIFDQFKPVSWKEKAAYVDRGIGTVLDGYTEADMVTLSNYWMNSSSPTACVTADFLLGHALLDRGESRRFIELPGMQNLCAVGSVALYLFWQWKMNRSYTFATVHTCKTSALFKAKTEKNTLRIRRS